jgi:hypothetical protein
MKSRNRILLIALALLFFIICGYWLKDFLAIDKCLDNGGRWNYDTGKCEYTEKSNSKTYRNNHYLFTFDYRTDWDLRELGKWSFDLLRNGTMYLHGSVEDNTFTIFINESNPQGDIFHSFSRMRVKTVCGADGPDGSRYCETIQSEKESVTPNGLRVLEFYLNVTQENYRTNTKHNSTLGPIYMVDISRGNHPRALLMYPGESTVSSDEISHLARDILKTIRLVN